ncbi:MAG: thioredoxin family protein [Elusimicrobia bacterium]|nr:thioredoxin family protein [Elusimicrobiota bacterium]
MTSLLLAAALAGVVSAAPWTAFDPAGFEAAKRSGKIVLLQFMDRDCTSCAEQERVVSKLFWGSSRADWVGYRVDLVRNADAAQALGVRSRSTLVLFHGPREVARNVGVIQESEILALLRQADIPEPRGRAGPRPGLRLPPRP